MSRQPPSPDMLSLVEVVANPQMSVSSSQVSQAEPGAVQLGEALKSQTQFLACSGVTYRYVLQTAGEDNH